MDKKVLKENAIKFVFNRSNSDHLLRLLGYKYDSIRVNLISFYAWTIFN